VEKKPTARHPGSSGIGQAKPELKEKIMTKNTVLSLMVASLFGLGAQMATAASLSSSDLARAERTEKAEKPQKPEKVGAIEGQQYARAERTEKAEKPQKPEKVG
jgi:hypothetical protein